MTPQDFVDAFKAGRKPATPVTGICSRIIRIKEPAHRKRLSGDDPSRRIVFVTDAAGSADLLGKNGWECLMHIGYPADWVKNDLLPNGVQFELIVFPETAASQATWENFLKVVATAYPEFAADCTTHLADLKSWKWPWYAMKLLWAIEAQKKQTPWKTPNEKFMSPDNYAKSPRDAAHFRAFLAHSCYANKLFHGDGFTYNDKGERGLAEYVMPDMEIDPIPGVARVDLTVVAP
jgi:hypothetical protein